jgi:hypothetical protein
LDQFYEKMNSGEHIIGSETVGLVRIAWGFFQEIEKTDHVCIIKIVRGLYTNIFFHSLLWITIGSVISLAIMTGTCWFVRQRRRIETQVKNKIHNPTITGWSVRPLVRRLVHPSVRPSIHPSVHLGYPHTIQACFMFWSSPPP